MTNYVAGFALLIVLIFVGIFVFYFAQARQQVLKTRMAGWQKLADKLGLSFHEPKGLFGSGSVTGIYQGREITLQHTTRSEGRHKAVDLTLVNLSGHKADDAPHLTIEIPPPPLDGKAMIKVLTPPDAPQVLQGKVLARGNGDEFRFEQRELILEDTRLEAIFRGLVYLAEAYDAIWERGAETIPALVEAAESLTGLDDSFIYGLAQDIAEDTRQTLSQQAGQLLCPRCMTRCAALEIGGWLNKISYYGCRSCDQSLEFLEGQAVAVLDERMDGAPQVVDGVIYLNWLVRRSLFDFEAVEIRQASDEEVERFAVQVGNDTDPYRQPHYGEMICTVWPEANLSPNALRILESQFGQVNYP
jgi:hypothetical protein